MAGKLSMPWLAMAVAVIALVFWSNLGAGEGDILSLKPGITVQWQSEVGRAYRLWWSDSLDPDAVWEAVGPLANGDGDIMLQTDIGDVDEGRAGILDTSRRYYKLEVRSAIGCNLWVEFDRTADGKPMWLYTSKVCDPTSYVPITVYNDGCVPVWCVNVELYWLPWTGCCNVYNYAHLTSCRLAKLSIRKIESMGAAKVKIPWHPHAKCNSLKVRVDPDNKDLDPWGAPIPCHWHNPAYPLGHVIEPDDCNWDDVPDPVTGKPANDNWDASKGNIPTIRPCWWTIVPLPLPNPHPGPWPGVLEIAPETFAAYQETFPDQQVELGLGMPTQMVEDALTEVQGEDDIDVEFDSRQVSLGELIQQAEIPPVLDVTIPELGMIRPVVVIHLPQIVTAPPVLPPILVNTTMHEWMDETGMQHPGHLTPVHVFPELEVGP